MCDEFERNHFFKTNLRQIQCYSELKEKNNTHVCFDVVICAVGHHHPPICHSEWLHWRKLDTEGSWDCHIQFGEEREICTPSVTHRSHNFHRESWYWNIHHEFSRQAFDIIWTCVSWYMLYFEMYFRLFLEWCYGFMIMYLWYLNIQVPKHFGLQLPSVRNAKRP